MTEEFPSFSQTKDNYMPFRGSIKDENIMEGFRPQRSLSSNSFVDLTIKDLTSEDIEFIKDKEHNLFENQYQMGSLLPFQQNDASMIFTL